MAPRHVKSLISLKMVVDAARRKPVSACIPCSALKPLRALSSRPRTIHPLESDVISVGYPKLAVETKGRFSDSGAVFAVAIRESRLSSGGIALSSAGIGLHVCGIRLRQRGIALPNGGSTLSLCGTTLPLSEMRLPLCGIQLSNSEVAWQRRIQCHKQAPPKTVGNSNHKGARQRRHEFREIWQGVGTEAIAANEQRNSSLVWGECQGSGANPIASWSTRTIRCEQTPKQAPTPDGFNRLRIVRNSISTGGSIGADQDPGSLHNI
ncbi:hypothetical protein QO014_004264 [Kaistia dalseonensis]|uniref:Uncharacterized protein n=1 Tax=Kaistia dalseonensis TaxID=410840 RepID=A0ABU0HDD9_9HYPH|nr:hypothetical protein [Kaistia dalseonensis]